MRVEEAWSFRNNNPNNSTATAVGNNPSSQDNNKVGEACYIAATVQNRRFYGVLVEQEALQTASVLHWQDEAVGLELNRRMRALQQAQSQQPTITTNTEATTAEKKATTAEDSQEMQVDGSEEIKDETTDQPPASERKESAVKDAPANPSTDSAPGPPIAATAAAESMKVPARAEPIIHSRKRPRDDVTVHKTSTEQRQVQKLSYTAQGDYRNLLATFVSVEAAAEDSAELQDAIGKACQNGGGFVGKYYYQYEVSRSL